MLIPYPYNPTTQDLWIYEDATLSYTVPEPTTIQVKRPIGWNPNSPLYGYRRSLRGISARLRTFSSFAGQGLVNQYSQYNDPILEVNKPVYYNSFPMQFTVMSPLFMWGCLHCFNMSGARNPNFRLVGPGGYSPNSLFDATLNLTWLDHDNSVIQTVSPQNVIRGYSTDPPTNLNCTGDLSMFEFLSPVSVPPMQVVDCRTAGHAQDLWVLDSNHKIIRVKMESASVQNGRDFYSFQAVKPDGSVIPTSVYEVYAFLHDSGSIALAEISPPTSPAAGDGVLGLVPAHVFSLGNLVMDEWGYKRIGYGDFDADGDYAGTPVPTNIFSYCASRGSPLLPVRNARRTTALASQSVDNQILAMMEGLLA